MKYHWEESHLYENYIGCFGKLLEEKKGKLPIEGLLNSVKRLILNPNCFQGAEKKTHSTFKKPKQKNNTRFGCVVWVNKAILYLSHCLILKGIEKFLGRGVKGVRLGKGPVNAHFHFN